ncbi:hypothetical protein KVV02_006060 [Mortierella alpina]|uniref:Uncharacterized protein n=1 Tax=Mortierella alpina TaxID=64518 RepID=A0A9P8CWD9_MORAP|nr:hypothetical protein KVV02_006060 [Mortierella alpina]
MTQRNYIRIAPKPASSIATSTNKRRKRPMNMSKTVNIKDQRKKSVIIGRLWRNESLDEKLKWKVLAHSHRSSSPPFHGDGRQSSFYNNYYFQKILKQDLHSILTNRRAPGVVPMSSIKACSKRPRQVDISTTLSRQNAHALCSNAHIAEAMHQTSDNTQGLWKQNPDNISKYRDVSTFIPLQSSVFQQGLKRHRKGG